MFKFTEVINDNFLVTYQKAVGQLMVRAGLMITDKEMKGDEQKRFTTSELKSAYLKRSEKPIGSCR